MTPGQDDSARRLRTRRSISRATADRYRDLRERSCDTESVDRGGQSLQICWDVRTANRNRRVARGPATYAPPFTKTPRCRRRIAAPAWLWPGGSIEATEAIRGDDDVSAGNRPGKRFRWRYTSRWLACQSAWPIQPVFGPSYLRPRRSQPDIETRRRVTVDARMASVFHVRDDGDLVDRLVRLNPPSDRRQHLAALTPGAVRRRADGKDQDGRSAIHPVSLGPRQC